mmetsp:Transcript_6774/g.19703  ORF Transcript_6774/g.19703 Transcript_6774/m.19703 type:complete len:467 (+) Transcript_6774:425-1825(+)
MNALIDGGADINAAGLFTSRYSCAEDGITFPDERRPIRVAIMAGNEAAVRILMQRHVNLRGSMVMELLRVPRAVDEDRPPSPDVERQLLLFYERLVEQDTTLATEQDQFGRNLVHSAAWTLPIFSQSFIDCYMGLLAANGADMTQIDPRFPPGRTPLQMATSLGSYRVAAFLCRQLPANEIDRGLWQQTPLDAAAEDLYHRTRPAGGRPVSEVAVRRTKMTICVLLRAGAAINRLPTGSHIPAVAEELRERRQLVLDEYTRVLNELPIATMAAVNAALRPHRILAALLTHFLPLVDHNDAETPLPSPLSFGHGEATLIGWQIAAYCFDTTAANQTVNQTLTFRHSRLARRVCAAIDHFVTSALKASSNREVVGPMAIVGEETVRVPLQCFVLGGVDRRLNEVVRTRGRVGIREVVHRARLDEAARYRLTGVIKGFNTHLGNDDCQFSWGQVGRIDDEGQFVTLGTN